jgi:hypothetical protein
VLRVTDLVDDDPFKRDRVSAAPKDPTQKNNRDHVDIIIALDMAKKASTGSGAIRCEHVAAHRDVLHKIGITGGDVAKRIANAELDLTFLMADVKIVATYELYNINRIKIENIIRRIFDAARLDIVIKDRFGQPVIPREWFLVPLFAINDAVERSGRHDYRLCVRPQNGGPGAAWYRHQITAHLYYSRVTNSD